MRYCLKTGWDLYRNMSRFFYFDMFNLFTNQLEGLNEKGGRFAKFDLRFNHRFLINPTMPEHIILPDLKFLKRMIFLLCSLMVLCTCHPSVDQNQSSARPGGMDKGEKVIMAIFAHPDDESTIAPILARYVREGVKVYVVIATDGRLGVNDFSGLEAGDGLVAIRKEEMKCAAEKLGVALIHLDYHDQLKAAEGYDGHMPHAQALILEVHQLITDLQPDVLITWGPDGGSNHMDHRLIGASVTSVYLSQQWEKPQSLFYYGSPASHIEDEESRKLRGVDDAYMTTRISYTDEDYEQAIAAMMCHESQFQIEGLRERMLSRKRDNKIYLRKFAGPQSESVDIFVD